MKIYKNIFKKLLFNRPGIIAIGYFDSVHTGHVKLINELLKIAENKKLKPYVLTFDYIPQKEKNGKRILDVSDKILIINDLGVKNFILCSFNEKFSHIGPVEFLKLLKNNFYVEHFVCSTDFSFGYNKAGEIDTIRKFGNKVFIVDPAIINNQKVSTSLIKNYILTGDIETANKLIGRPFFINGNVIKGKQKGRDYGFPTLNIFNKNIIKPANGVYITRTEIKNKKYYSMTYVADDIIETYLLNYNKFYYNIKIKVDFFQKIRDNMSFANKSILIKQLNKDLDKLIDFVKNRSIK
ncbi:MAG: riboflavin biosynthesis protein RibF [Spirochaetes bacterium]|nr:riboflavin biosynthesis protein RibF [Spirochaetota bacterium]